MLSTPSGSASRGPPLALVFVEPWQCSFRVALSARIILEHVSSPGTPKQAASTEVSGDLSGLANLKDLRLIFFGDGELLLNLQDLLWCMFMKQTFHVGCKFAQKISDRI